MTKQTKATHDPDKTDKTHPTLNEWGIPDWRDEKAYGDVDDWSLDRWRWEFFRRREDLRNFFDERAESTYRSNQECNNNPTIRCFCFEGLPSEPGFAVTGRNTGTLFGYICIPNPRIGDQPDGILKPTDDYWLPNILDGNSNDDIASTTNHSDSFSVKSEITVEQISQLSSKPFRYFPIALNRNEVAIKFDVNRPLEPQLKKARDSLRSMQIKRHGKPVQLRKHIKKWLAYLRSLDAREAGASWSGVSTLHSETKQTDQTGRDKWNQAYALCFNF